MGGIVAAILIIMVAICLRKRKNAVSAHKTHMGEHPLFTVKRPGPSWSSRDYKMPGVQANKWSEDAYYISNKKPSADDDHQYSEISSSFYQAPHGRPDQSSGPPTKSRVYLEPSALQMSDYDKAKGNVSTAPPMGFGSMPSAIQSSRSEYEEPSAAQMIEYDKARESNRDYIDPNTLSRHGVGADETETDL